MLIFNYKTNCCLCLPIKGHSYKVVGNGRYRDAVNSDTFDGLFKTNFVIERKKMSFKK
jgi:hypothetical protein